MGTSWLILMTVLLRRLSILLLPKTYFLIEATGVRGFQGPKTFHVRIYGEGQGGWCMGPNPPGPPDGTCSSRHTAQLADDVPPQPLSHLTHWRALRLPLVPKGTGQAWIGTAVKCRHLPSRASSTSGLWTTTPPSTPRGLGQSTRVLRGPPGGPHSLIMHYGILCFLPVWVCKLPQVSCPSSLTQVNHPTQVLAQALLLGGPNWDGRRPRILNPSSWNSRELLTSCRLDSLCIF